MNAFQKFCIGCVIACFVYGLQLIFAPDAFLQHFYNPTIAALPVTKHVLQLLGVLFLSVGALLSVASTVSEPAAQRRFIYCVVFIVALLILHHVYDLYISEAQVYTSRGSYTILGFICVFSFFSFFV